MKKTIPLILSLMTLFQPGCISDGEQSIAKETHFIPFPQLFWEADSRAFTDVGAPVEYDIQIARDASFRDVVDEDRVAIARYVPDSPLPVGSYFWRVRPVVSGEIPGPWSPVLGLEIVPADEIITVAFDPQSENHQPVIEKAISKAIELNQQGLRVEVRFEAGTYRVGGTRNMFSIDGANQLIINGDGARIHLLQYNMGAGRIMNSRDVLVRGFVIDYPEERTFLQARVLEINRRENYMVVEVDEGSDTYSAEYAIRGLSHFSLLDPTIDGRLKTGAANFFPIAGPAEQVEEGRFHIPIGRTAGIQAGDRLVHFVRRSGQSLFYAGDSERLTYYRITNHSTGGGHYVGVSTSQVSIIHCHSDILGDRWFAGNADGVHLRNNRIGPWIEGFRINAVGDDGVALYSRPVRASQTWPDGQRNALIITREFFDLEPGDQVSFFNPEEGRIFLETYVETVEPVGRDFRVTFKDDIPRELAFGTSLQDDDQIWNRSTSSGNFMIRNSSFTNVRRFGVVFRAKTGVVENNVFDGTSSSAVLFFNETQYPNGLYCSDIIIRNNTINDAAFDSQPLGVIVMEFRRRQTGHNAADQGPRRILIENNQITNSAATTIELGSVRDIVLRGNTLDGQPLNASNSNHADVRNSENIRWE
jgi:hypothetical protein